MSTTARDKAWEDYAGTAPSISRDTWHAFEAGWDAGRASVLSALTEERIRRSLRSVLCDVANYPEPASHRLLGRDLGSLINKATAAVVALIEQETTK